MAPTELYRIALERSTQPDLPTEHNEIPHNMPSLTETDRTVCEGWLQEINFLRPGVEEEDEVWEKIKRNWIGYLSATSPLPDATLAPNRKVVQFAAGDGDGDEGVVERRRRFERDRRRRMIIQSAFWNGLDGIEAMTERWPRAARAALNSMDRGEEEEDRGAFESLAAVYDLGRRRRYQAIWTSLVGFIVHSYDEGTLEEMGLQLKEGQIDDILDIEQEVWSVDLRAIARRREKGGFEDVWAPIQQLLFKALRRPKSTARNNPLVWWLAVLVRSAVSDDRDFISRGRFHKNPVPMDIDLEERLRAIVHYSKVLVLDDAFSTWSERPEWVMEVQSCLNRVSIDWINDERGSRPARSSDGPVYSTAAWQSVVTHIAEHTSRYIGGKKKTAIHRVRLLADEIGQ
ncbi:hypothetical protein BGZ61DRAFT_462910 [Ilyonectria robusta]|uniref:uncharacterized protein n=1 Tax=Ilyonectria robusta TaxID=1079257 RepID=UPI001E8DE33B|nr:uncharacterized protein BGZ61DRAFT_462910 [Ilyonectria robusta]KAH8662635.1 hypothetical protein BGZ61DRAFT_462910 [Ilyonectria robusta]